MSIEEELKKEMGYSENEHAKCVNCIHSQEVACKYVDRMWYRFCNYNTIKSFQVQDNARCDKFETNK